MRRATAAVFALIVALPVAAMLGSGMLLDTAFVRSRLQSALERATGHAARLDGPVWIHWSLTPGIEVRDVVLLNRAGASRPAFATVRRVLADVALLPLLSGRVEVRGVTLEQPDVLLERDAAGRGNWLPPPGDAVPEAAPAAEGAAPRGGGGGGVAVEVRRVHVQDGRIAWRDGPVVAIPMLRLAPSGGPVSGELVVNGVPVAVQGRTEGRQLDLAISGPGLAVAVAGTPGGAVAVQARAAALEALAPLAGRALPPLRDVQASFAWPGPTALRVTAGAGALDGVMPGLAVQQLVLEADAPDRPLRLAAVVTLRQLPVAVAAGTSSLAALLAGGAVPVQLRMEADGGTLTAQGSVNPAARTAEMTLSARVPDLRRGGTLAGLDLPGLHDLSMEGRVLPRPAGSGGGAGLLLRGLRVTAAEGDLAGDLALGTRPRPSLRGSLVSQRLDLDAILAPAQAPPQPQPPAPVQAAPGPAAPVVRAVRPPPFAALLAADADLGLAVAQASLRGVAYRAIEVRVLLQDGRLRLDPAQMQAPGGPVRLQVLADAAARPPTAAVTLQAAALDAAPLAAALGEPGGVTGTLEMDVRLRAAGADWPALAASLDGHLAAAMTQGEIENQVLARWFGAALRAASLPAELGGRSQVRCLAMRAEAAAGQVAVRTIALDTTKLRLEGDGTVNLVNETMDLHLRPTIRIGPTGVVVPVRLTGPWRAPSPAVERGVIAPGRFGLSIGAAGPDPCPAALAAVRAP